MKNYIVILITALNIYYLNAQNEPDYRNRQSNIFYNLAVQPYKYSMKGNGDSLKADFQFRISFNELLFINLGGTPTAYLKYNISLRNEDNIITKRLVYIDTVYATNSETINKTAFYLKNLSLSLNNGNYTYEIDIEQPNRQTIYNKKGKIDKFDGFKSTNRIGKPIYASEINGRFYTSVLDSALDFKAEKLVIFMPISDNINQIQYNIKRVYNNVENKGFTVNYSINKTENAQLINKMMIFQNKGDNSFEMQDITDFPISYAKIVLSSDIAYPGDYQLTINNRIFNFQILYINQPNSLKNNSVAVRTLSLIANDDEMKKIRSAREDAQYSMINDFFKNKDTNPNTLYNETMNEYYRRVDYALQNYSDFNNTPGNTTARGKIYILYGLPDNIDIENNPGKSIETWHYNKMNKTVKFQVLGAGEYRLIKD